MSALFLQNGGSIDYTPTVDLPTGSVVVLGDLIGVTTRPLSAGVLGALHLTGVFSIDRTPGTVIPAGSRLFWDATNKVATIDDNSGANPVLGVSIAEAVDTDAIVQVRLAN